MFIHKYKKLADDCRRFPPSENSISPRVSYFDNPNTIYRNVYHRRLPRLTAIPKQYH